MPIAALPTPPQRSDPANFASRGDAFMTALPTFATEANALATAVNADAATASAGASTATTQAGIATTQAGNASTSAGTSTTQAGIATTQAGIATTQAGNALASANAAAASAAVINLTAPGPIGGTTPSTGAFTTLSAAGTSNFASGSINWARITGGISADYTTISAEGEATTFLKLKAKGAGGLVVAEVDGSNRGLFSSTGLAVTGVVSVNEDGIGTKVIKLRSNWSGSSPAIEVSTNDPVAFVINGSEKARIDASGNLGLGVTPSAWYSDAGRALQINNVGITQYVGFDQTAFLTNAYYSASATWKYIGSATATRYDHAAGTHKWFTAPSGTAGNPIAFTQAMTLDVSGNLLVGRTAAGLATSGAGFSKNAGGACLEVVQGTTGVACAYFNQSFGSGTQTIADMRFNNTQVGTINVTSTATAYNTSSDYRLKNVIGPVTNSGAYIDSLNPVEGTWKADNSTFVGLIAHEVQEASRTNVATGTKDGTDMQAMDYSSSEIIANLIAEIQSLRARVAQLEGI